MANALLETTDVKAAIAEEIAASPGLLEIKFYTTTALSEEDAQPIFDHLYSSGVDVRSVSVHQKKTGLPYLRVVYNKPAPSDSIAALPVAVIPLIAFGFIMSLVGIGVWKIEDITNNIAKLLLIVFGGTIILVAVARKPLEAAAVRYLGK